MSLSTESPAHGVERREIDGIPTWISPRATRYTGALLFRVGTADERLPTLGQTHIIEHLVLFRVGPHVPYDYNGFVAGLIAGFYATGEPDEVAGFLTAVAAGLHDLPMSRLRDETRVLRTEAASRSTGFIEDALWLRYGCAGHGLRRMPELALYAPDAASIQAWVAERFTSGNAALWFSGPPPEGFHPRLPPGPRMPCPKPTPIAGLSFPSSCLRMSPLVAMTFEHPREDWLGIPLQVVQSRVFDQLRYSRGLAYDVSLAYEPVEAETVHAAIVVNCLAEHAAAVRDALLSTVREVARDGATEEELERIRANHCRYWNDPDAGIQEITTAANNELMGYRVRRAAELIDDLSHWTPADVARRMAAALPNAMLVSPPHLQHSEGYTPYPSSAAPLPSGRKFRTIQQRFPWSRGPRLVIGPEGVSLALGNELAAVRYDSCAAAAVEPSGVVRMWSNDGFEVVLAPGGWRGADRAIEEVVNRVPADRLVRVVADPATPPVVAAPTGPPPP